MVILYGLEVVAVFVVIIFVHELGHFLAAKAVGVGVERFSFGFGPVLLGRRIGETEYVLSAVPLGGYVKMVGEEIGELVTDADIERSFSHKSLGKRFFIVFAGPLFNLIAAFLFFSGTFLAFGVNVPGDTPQVGGVVSGLPAYKAGLEEGDLVLNVAGKAVHTWEELAERIQQSEGKAIILQLEKASDGRTVEVTVQPELRSGGAGDPAKPAYVIGIERMFNRQEVSTIRALVLGVEQTYLWTWLILDSLAKLLSLQVPASELGGPILIAQVAGQQAQLGLDNLLRFIAIISVNLAVLNLLPIPVLDGGHLFFFLIELLIGRPVSVRYREVAWRMGFLFIILLIVFVFYNDIARMIEG
jgi:regulator of sigma E protease